MIEMIIISTNKNGFTADTICLRQSNCKENCDFVAGGDSDDGGDDG